MAVDTIHNSMDSRLLHALEERIGEATGDECHISTVESVSGGDINTSYLLRSDAGPYFVKCHTGDLAAQMFHTEANALRTLHDAQILKVPVPVAIGEITAQPGRALHYFIMEALPLGGRADWSRLGTGLADLHARTGEHYGWFEDNFIGTSPQTNQRSEIWSEFWWQCRLQPQLERALANGYHSLKSAVPNLKTASDQILRHHQPEPSLVHGDLWSGNVDFTPDRQPCIYDPASYYGDREVDLALSRLFGGFGGEFYRVYLEKWPLPAGHELRTQLYNFYHLLNHLNLFGAGYLDPCERTAAELTSQY